MGIKRWLLVVCVFISTPLKLWATENALLEQCLQTQIADESSLCQQAAHSVVASQEMLDYLGRQLEAQMRYAQAVAVYEIGSKQHSHSKSLLQGLIRTRAAWRQQRKPFRSNYVPDADHASIDLEALAQQTNNQVSAKQQDQHQLLSSVNHQYKHEAILSGSDSLPGTQLGNVKPKNTRDAKLSALSTGKSYALIIGNNSYRARDFPDLYTAVNDAKKIASVLKKKYGFDTRLLLNANRYQTMAAISSLRKTAGSEDKILIYYAGHGVLDEVTNRGYWLPVDAEPGNIANWISTSDVTDVLAGMSAKHAMVIADSCFSGSLLRNSVTTNLDERNALLLRLNSKKSRTVLTSGGLEPVQDDGGGKHSVFANTFINILQENQSILEAERLFVQLREQVILRADQTPQYAPIRKAGHDGGDFIFIPI